MVKKKLGKKIEKGDVVTRFWYNSNNLDPIMLYLHFDIKNIMKGTKGGGEEFTWFGSFDDKPSLSCHLFYRDDNGI